MLYIFFCYLVNKFAFCLEFILETVELLENIPVTFDGRKEIRYTAPGVDFGGKDFSLVAKVMTGIGGTIVSKVRPQGDWEKNCKSLFINLDGFVTFSVGEVGMIQSRTKVNDGQDHEVALVYVAEEGRYRVVHKDSLIYSVLFVPDKFDTCDYS